jgi:hypothetical protein
MLRIGDAIAEWVLGIPEKIEDMKKSISDMFSGIGDNIPSFVKTIFGFSGDEKTGKTESPKDVIAKAQTTAQPITNFNTDNKSQKSNTVTVNQNIMGGNSLEVAEETARRFQNLDMYPGEYAPVTQ